MKLRLCVVSASLLILGAAALLFAQLNGGSQAHTLSKADALRLVRNIGTAEAEEKDFGKHGYGTLQDLSSHRFLPQYVGTAKNHGAEIRITDHDSATVEDYSLSVVVSPDGQHFQLSLVPNSGCGEALFLSDSFVIYEGRALDCPTG